MDEERQYFIASVRSLAKDKYRSCGEDGTIIWKDGATDLPTDAEIEAERLRLEAEYDAQEYARNRQAEYPTIAELTVALYDTDDKADIEAKRAAVKAKYPKPE